MADSIVKHPNDTAAAPQALKHPAFAQPPVVNVKARGRKKGVVSFQAEVGKRRPAQPPSPELEPCLAPLSNRKRGVYCYPKSMLWQQYFCRLGNGVLLPPSMGFSMLADEKFVSPIDALLDQLEIEGHDVSGARAEWLAFRELAVRLDDDVDALSSRLRAFGGRRPAKAAMLIDPVTAPGLIAFQEERN